MRQFSSFGTGRLPEAGICTYDGGQVGTMHYLPKFLYVLVDYPVLIAVPIIVFAALALWSGSRTCWLTAIAWVLYLGYELGMHAELLCSDSECLKRTPLYFVYPLLAFLSLVALTQVYVRIRDRRFRERASAIHR